MLSLSYLRYRFRFKGNSPSKSSAFLLFESIPEVDPLLKSEIVFKIRILSLKIKACEAFHKIENMSKEDLKLNLQTLETVPKLSFVPIIQYLSWKT